METLEKELDLTRSVTDVNNPDIKRVLGKYAYWNSESDKFDKKYRGGSCSFCEGEDINGFYYQA